jgi:hypothetical protein
LLRRTDESEDLVSTPASALPQPRAARLRRPSWRDSRLLIGVVIVLASVAFGSRVVAAADSSTPVFAAAVTLPAGHTLTTDDITIVRVRLGGATKGYLTVATGMPLTAVMLRTVAAGELIPLTAVGPASALTRRPVSVPVPAPVPDGLVPGAQVDVWSSAKEVGAGSSGYRPPARIATGASIASVSGDGSGLGAARSATVQVLLEETELKAVLDALANGARLALVPAPAGA